MPVFTEQELQPAGLAGFAPRAPAAPKPSIGETIGAAFSQNNTVGSAIGAFKDTFAMNEAARSNPVNFDPLQDLPEQYRDHASSFVGAINPGQVEIIKRRVDDELRAREVLARAGGVGIAASVGAGILDPVNLIPIGGWAAKGAKGASVLGHIAEGAVVGGLSASASEAVLMATQEDRSYEEAAANIAGGVVLGGALGGAVGLFKVHPNAGKITERFASEWDAANAPQVVRSSSVGAAARAGGEDLRPAPAFGLEKLEAKNPVSDNPLLRSLSSQNQETARIAAELAETPYFLTGNDKGVASPLAAETRIKQWQGPLAQSLGGVDDAFKRYRFGRDGKLLDMTKAGIEDLTGQAGGKLSFADFKVEVAKAMRNGDASAIPQVAEAAKDMRARIFDPLKDEAIKLGLLPEDVEVTTADSYLTRVYNLEKIASQRNTFIDNTLVPWLSGLQEGASARFTEAEEGLAKSRAVIEQEGPALGPLRKEVGDVTRKAMEARSQIDIRKREAMSLHKAALGLEGDLAKAQRRVEELSAKTEPDAIGVQGDVAARRAKLREAEFAVRRVEERLQKQRESAGVASKAYDDARLDAEFHGERINEIRFLSEAAEERLKRAHRMVDRYEARMEAERGLGLSEDGEIRAIAEEIVAKLLGQAPGRTSYDVTANMRGPMRERTLNIPDELIEDYLENDVERVARIYTRTMAADVELARAFGRPDMSETIEGLKASYEPIMASTKDGPGQAKLKTSIDRDVRDLEAMRDRIRGTYGIPDNPADWKIRAARSLRTINYLRMLGGMTLSAIPDVARPIMVHGLGRVMGDGLRPLLTNLKAVRLAGDEVKLAGTALDMVLDSRAQQLADVFEDFGRYSRVERAITYAGEKMGLASGMSLWNAGMKQFTGLLTQTRTLRAIVEGASPAEARRLAFLGIDQDMGERIAKEFKTHGGKESGVWLANTTDWTDAEAAATYRGALAKEVDIIIATPGQEKPLWLSSELGKTIGQFKTFTFSSMSRVMINSLQQRDANALQGFVAAVALGMLAYQVKSAVAGKETSDDPRKWISEGLDQSGTLGWIFEANNVAEKVTRGRAGVNAAMGVAPSSRYADRNIMDTLMGPSVGTVNDAASIVGSASEGKLSRSDLHRARRLLPFQNLFYLRWLFNHAEDEAGDAAGLPEKAN
jgi:hypothetical protein